MSVFFWSQTAATNASADSTINWAEGQSPSTVNDSARAMMAALAKYRDDISGSITTSGTSTAYTVTSNSGFDTLAHLNGQIIAFVPHTTCGATVTLNVDSLGAKPLRSAPSVELLSGMLIQGTPYVATYNNSDGAFYLQGCGATALASSIPVGAVMPYAGSSAPSSNFALLYGQAISQTTYAALYTVIGANAFGTDSGGNFSLPDVRGRVIAGLDNMGGSAANRITSGGSGITGTTRGATGGAETHTLTTTEMPAHSHTITDPGHSHTYSITITAGGANVPLLGGATSGSINTNSATTGITGTNSNGSGGAHNITQPTIILPYIMRVI